MLKTSAPV